MYACSSSVHAISTMNFPYSRIASEVSEAFLRAYSSARPRNISQIEAINRRLAAEAAKPHRRSYPPFAEDTASDRIRSTSWARRTLVYDLRNTSSCRASLPGTRHSGTWRILSPSRRVPLNRWTASAHYRPRLQWKLKAACGRQGRQLRRSCGKFY